MKDMKVKIDICDPSILAHERCQYRTPTGRQCTRRVHDFEAAYCPKHATSQLNDYDDIAPALTENASKFLNAQGINYSLAALYKLLASGRISPRRASTLAYISSLLLRSLNAIDNDPYPNAGKDKPPAPEDGTILAKATVNGKIVNLVATPTHARAGKDSSKNPVPQSAGKLPSTNPVPQGGGIAGKDSSNNPTAQSGIEAPLPQGTTPISATRKDFAQQVFAQLEQNESEPPAHALNNPIYKAHAADLPTAPPPAPGHIPAQSQPKSACNASPASG